VQLGLGKLPIEENREILLTKSTWKGLCLPLLKCDRPRRRLGFMFQFNLRDQAISHPCRDRGRGFHCSLPNVCFCAIHLAEGSASEY
jgi:hypothetical protein